MYNPYSLEGKTILITGAASGIGKATSIESSKLGAKIVAVDLNAEGLEKLMPQLEGEGHLSFAGTLCTDCLGCFLFHIITTAIIYLLLSINVSIILQLIVKMQENLTDFFNFFQVLYFFDLFL